MSDTDGELLLALADSLTDEAGEGIGEYKREVLRTGGHVLRQIYNRRESELAALRAKLAVAEGKHELADTDKDLSYAVDAFAFTMKTKLYAKAMQGYTDWDDPQYKEVIEKKLYEHVERQKIDGNQLIDIANLAMMLWHFKVQALTAIRGEGGVCND